MKKYIFAGMILGISLLGSGCGHKEDQMAQDIVYESAEGETISTEEETVSAEEETMSAAGEADGDSGSVLTVTQKGRLREDMPEFTFYLTAYWDAQWDSYALQSLEVCDGDTVLQTIDIPELTLFGRTGIYDDMKDTLGFGLEDVNFDGYLDIRQFDTPNGNYRQEWIYLVWNPAENRFEHDTRLNEISLATFDQEEQLIYGMERGGAVLHYYSTYQYMDGKPVKIRYVEEEGVYLDDDRSRAYCLAASEKDDAVGEGNWYYIHVMERNGETGELETVSEEYVFDSDEENEELRVDADSELGQQIAAESGRQGK